MGLQAQPWWTPADDAELDVLVRELVKTVGIHRRDCSACAAGGPWCTRLADAFDEAVLGWIEARVLSSRAAWLRTLQDRADAQHEREAVAA
jgi:hypothetical protein